MDILFICAVAVITAAAALTIRRYSAEQALLLSVGASAVILLFVLRQVIESVAMISDLLSQSGISENYILILVKSLGICFLTEFSCDAVSESGITSMSSSVLLAGKIMVLIIAMPLFTDIFSTVASLL